MQLNFLSLILSFVFLLSGCSDDVSAICDGQKSRILYSKRDHKKLLETKNCQDCKLNGNQADLSNLDLSEANLSGTELAGANLSGTNLTGANLNRVIFADIERLVLWKRKQKKILIQFFLKALTLLKQE